MDSSLRSGSGKLFIDSIHGDIHLTGREVEIIDTASFQRLRQLKQLAMAQLVYPAATHTRFAHSIGVLGTMIRILYTANKKGITFDKDEEENLRLAALLHDVGHYPYSHLMETIDRVRLTEEQIDNATSTQKLLNATKSVYPDHRELGKLIVTEQRDLIDAIGGNERAQAVADLFTRAKVGHPQLNKLISSSLDLDRLDYLLRDSQATGVPYGQIDIAYLLNNLKVSPEKMVGFSDKALPAAEHMLLARFFMHRAVYYHKTTYGLEEACRQLLRRLRDDNRKCKEYGIPIDGEEIKERVTGPKLFIFTDAFVDNVIQKAVDDKNEVIKALARAVQKRRPPALLKEVQVCEKKGQAHHAGTMFMSNCKSKLDKLAGKFDIPLGQFLLCETKPLFIGERPEELTAREAAKLRKEEVLDRAAEEEEKDIKIFVGDDDRTEPVSLLNMEHSLVAKYSDYSFQIFRLYVIHDGNNRDKVVAELQDKVKDWDKR